MAERFGSHMRLKKFALRGMIILAAVVALCVLFSGTIRTLTTAKVRYAAVKNGKFENVVELTGSVAFPEEEEIILKIPEGLSLTVTRIPVSAGQRVSTGDRLLVAVVTDAEKNLATLQQEYDTARNTLDAWKRKNGDMRVTRNETLWMEAYEETRKAEAKEREARLELMAMLELSDPAALTDEALQESGILDSEKGSEWKLAKENLDIAKAKKSSLDRYAVAEDVWTVLQQKTDAEKKMQDAEDQMMKIKLLEKQAQNITATHKGYIVSVEVEKNAVLTGEALLMTVTPKDKEPVLRAELPDTKQAVAKGSVLSIPTEYWGRLETKVIATGVSESGRPYVDAEITDDITWALGSVSTMLKNEKIKMRLTTKAKEATCLIAASAVRGSGDGRYVYVGETETSPLGDARIVVRKREVNVLGESGKWVSVSEDLTYDKVLYMEDRVINENDTVMLYEE